MKKIIFILIAVFLMAVPLSACQESPKSDIVVQKGSETKEAAPDSSGSISKYSAPSDWKEDISYDKSVLKIKMDAPIDVPSAQKLPSYECKDAEFSQGTLDSIISEFFGNAPIYDANAPQSKAEIQQQILDLELDIQKAENGEPDTNGNPIADPDFLKDWVKELKEDIKKAPDSVEKSQIDTNISALKPDKFGTLGFYGKADVPGKGTWLINLMLQNPKTSGSGINISHDKLYLLDTKDNEEENKDKSPTKDEAAEMAEALLKQLGITNMHLFSADFAKQTTGGGDAEASNTYGYNLTFVRDVDGITCLDRTMHAAPPSSTQSSIGSDTRQYSRMAAPESIEIGITKNGIDHFDWTGHYDLGTKITDNVDLVPFDQIKEAFKKDMLFTYSYLDDPGIVKDMKEPEKYQTMYVYKIKLGYAVTAVKNDPNNMMLTPVWNFYSYWVDKNGIKEYDWQPCMSINATDGSVL